MRLAERCSVCSASIWCGRQCKSVPGDMANNMANTVPDMANTKNDVANKGAYRYRDPDARRAYMRDLMARKRAMEK